MYKLKELNFRLEYRPLRPIKIETHDVKLHFSG